MMIGLALSKKRIDINANPFFKIIQIILFSHEFQYLCSQALIYFQEVYLP
jgi:hypothetical protein